MHRSRWIALLSVLFAAAVGYLVAGRYLYQAAIGLDPSAFPAGEALERIVRVLAPRVQMSGAGLALAALALVGAAALAFLAVAVSVRRRVSLEDPMRRRFLTGTLSGLGTAIAAVLVGGAAGLARALWGLGRDGRGWRPILQEVFAKAPYTHPTPLPSWRGNRVRAYRRLGRTDWRVSDIVLGTGRIRGQDGEQIAREALERGVNYFDTAPDYSGAGSEQAMGRALRGVARDRVFVATKFCTPRGHLPAGSPVSAYKDALEGSLQRLGTDHVDLVHIHSCDALERLLDESAHEAFDRLREEGKVRFLGFSSHTPRLAEVADAAIRSGRFDVMMLAYHHGIWPGLGDLIHRARNEQDMGVVAMKTLKGAKHRGLEHFAPYADSYAQAALRWALSNSEVSCAVISFFEPQHVDEFLSASGRPFTEEHARILRDYDRRTAGTYCAPHCGACLESCPAGLAIPDVLRHRMYFEDYGWEDTARELYARLERDAAACTGCSAPCVQRCPLGIPVGDRMRGAHALLT